VSVQPLQNARSSESDSNGARVAAPMTAAELDGARGVVPDARNGNGAHTDGHPAAPTDPPPVDLNTERALAEERLPPARGWILPLSVLIIGTFMSVLDTSIVNVAIPKIQIELSASPDDVEWVVTGYTLALGIIVPLVGWLGDRMGKTRMYIVSMIGFAAASMLCGAAWDLNSLVFFRIVQAIPGGILPVVTMTLLYEIVPRDRLGAATGIYGLGVVVAPAIGPTLGGYLVEYVDWRLIFYINVPVGIVGALAAISVFPNLKPTSWPKFDLWGFVTIAYGLFALLLASSEGHSWGWGGYRIMGLFVSAGLSLALFVIIELEVDKPLLDLRVFGSLVYVNSLVMMAIGMIAVFSSLYFIPQFLQIVQGMQPLRAGLVMVPSAAVLLLMMPISGRLYDAFGPRWPGAAGMVILAIGSFLLSDITPDTPLEDVALWSAIRQLGSGLCFMPIITAGISALPSRLTGAASGMNNIVQRVASSVAIAALGSASAVSVAQMMSDRGALYGSGAQTLPQVAEYSAGGASGLLGMYTQVSKAVLTETYANGFYLVAMMCVVGVPLAFLLPNGKPGYTGEPVALEH
jgi:EmrB/QacA subfamily drug resistance transporter